VNRMHDETLLWLYRQLREENAHRPPEQRIGLRRYLREHGIMSPERQRIVDQREIPFSTLGYDNFGEVYDEETDH
jgi:hypothetical protein